MQGGNIGRCASADCLAANLFGPELMGGTLEQQRFTSLHRPDNEKCRSLSLSGASTATCSDSSSPVSDVELSPNRGTFMHVEGIGPVGTFMHVEGIGPVDQRVFRSMQSLPATSNTFVYVDGIGPVKDNIVRPNFQTVPECTSSRVPASPEVVPNVMPDAGARQPAPEVQAAAGMAAPLSFAAAGPAWGSLPDRLAFPGAAYSAAPLGLAVPTSYIPLPLRWESGTEVVIHGLSRSPAFNGLKGVVHALDEQTGRYEILVMSPDGFGHQWAKIKGENLQLFVPPALPLPPPPQAAAR